MKIVSKQTSPSNPKFNVLDPDEFREFVIWIAYNETNDQEVVSELAAMLQAIKKLAKRSPLDVQDFCDRSSAILFSFTRTFEEMAQLWAGTDEADEDHRRMKAAEVANG